MQKETRQNATLTVCCGQIEKNTVAAIAEDWGYQSVADFLRDAINSFAGEEILIPRNANNQHVKRGAA